MFHIVKSALNSVANFSGVHTVKRYKIEDFIPTISVVHVIFETILLNNNIIVAVVGTLSKGVDMTLCLHLLYKPEPIMINAAEKQYLISFLRKVSRSFQMPHLTPRLQ